MITDASHPWDTEDEEDTRSSTTDLRCSLDLVTIKALEMSHSTSASQQKSCLLFQFTNIQAAFEWSLDLKESTFPIKQQNTYFLLVLRKVYILLPFFKSAAAYQSHLPFQAHEA